MMTRIKIKTIEYDSKSPDTVKVSYTKLVGENSRANFSKIVDKLTFHRMYKEDKLLKYLEDERD